MQNKTPSDYIESEGLNKTTRSNIHEGRVLNENQQYT